MNGAASDDSWRTSDFRNNIVQKVDEAIQKAGTPTCKSSIEMENHVYRKSKNKEEYLSYVAQLIVHIKDMSRNKKSQMSGEQMQPGQPMRYPMNRMILRATAHPFSGNQGMKLIPQQGTSQHNASNCAPIDDSWRTSDFRNNVIQKIDEAIQKAGTPTCKSSIEMENHVYRKSKNKDDYLSYVARLILHIRETGRNKKSQMSGEQMQPGQPMRYPMNRMILRATAHPYSGNQGMKLIPQQGTSQHNASNCAPIDDSWRTSDFRNNVIQKIDEAIQKAGTPTCKSSIEMEKHVYRKSKNKDDYLSYVARLILHIRETGRNKESRMSGQQMQPGQPMQYPMNTMTLTATAHPSSGNQGMKLIPQQGTSQHNASNCAPIDDSWRTSDFRNNVVQKMDEAIQKAGIPTCKSSIEMENHVYRKSKNKEEYLSYVAQLIVHIKDMSRNKKSQMSGEQMQPGQPMQYPMNTMTLTATAHPFSGNQGMKLIPQQGTSQHNASNCAPIDDSWRTSDFRNNVVQKIDEAIQKAGTPTCKSSIEIEKHVYRKSKNKEKYLSYVARLILHIREMGRNKESQTSGQQMQLEQSLQDLMNALRL